MRPNWFLAFPLEGAFVLDLPPLPSGLRRYHPGDVHLTLAFLGGCSEEAAHRALAALDARLDASLPQAIDITLGPVVPMGAPRSYSVLAALLARGREEMEDLLGTLRDPLTEAATGRREKRPPKPHVTLARPQRAATEAQREAGLHWALSLDLDRIHARLDRVALYTWAEVRRPRLFRIVEERTFG